MIDETIFTILRAFRARAGAHWLLLFDFDGTLVDVVTSPDGAKISDTTHGLLDALIERDDCTVGIVSGREISDLRQRTALGSTAWLAGAHGFEIEGPDGTFVHPAIDDARETFIAIATQVRKELHRFPGVAVERKRAALVLHTLAADAGVGARARERFIEVSQPYIDADQVRLHAGRVAFELLAQEAARRGLGTAPEVAEARTRAAVSALVEQEVERKIQTPADLPDSLTRRLLERNRWRLHRVEYRASFFVRFPVAKGEPREGPADRAARANAERVAQALAGERGLFAHHVRQRARELIGAATMEDGTVELSDPPRLVPAYSDALFALPELGRTSGAVRTDWGWDIILWTGVLPARDITPDELALELFPELRQMYFVAWSRSIGKSTKVEVFPEAFDRALGMTAPAKEPR